MWPGRAEAPPDPGRPPVNRLEFKDVHDRHLGRAIRMQAEQNGDTRFILADRTVTVFTKPTNG
jgi:hypothetical protein